MSEPVTSYATFTDEQPDPGAIAVTELSGEPWIFWVDPDQGVVGRDLVTGDTRSLGVWADGLGLADVDGDGQLDLLLAKWDAVVLALGTEEERWEELPGDGTPREVGATDLDGDGDLDLIYLYRGGLEADPEAMRPAVLYAEGGGKFGPPVAVAGDPSLWGAGFDLTVLDLDGDTAPDAYVCNDHGDQLAENLVLLNDGAGTLTPTTLPGLDVASACMGVAWGDPNQDGALDAYVGVSSGHHLLEDAGDTWIDAAAAEGLAAYPSPRMPWGAAFGDMENDGEEDLLVGSGCFRTPTMEAFDAWWFRRQRGAFIDEAVERGFALDSATRGTVVRDLNGDGVLDAVLGDATRSPWIYLSEGCTAEAWVEVEAPIGSRVVVEAGGVTRGALVTNESGWGSSATGPVHFGLGDAETLDRIEVFPPWSEPVRIDGPIEARRRITWAR